MNFENIYFECNVKPLFELILREAEELNSSENSPEQIWQTIKSLLKTNEKQLPIVDFNPQNYEELLGGGSKPINTGYNNTQVTMANGSNGEFDLYKKLSSKEGERGLKAGRTILLAGIKETLENPTLVISDHDEKNRCATSYIRGYNYNNDRGQGCNRLLKVIVTSDNIVISSYFVEYENIRKLIFDDEKILKQ
jgi:hypothetical protein